MNKKSTNMNNANIRTPIFFESCSAVPCVNSSSLVPPIVLSSNKQNYICFSSPYVFRGSSTSKGQVKSLQGEVRSVEQKTKCATKSGSKEMRTWSGEIVGLKHHDALLPNYGYDECTVGLDNNKDKKNDATDKSPRIGYGGLLKTKTMQGKESGGNKGTDLNTTICGKGTLSFLNSSTTLGGKNKLTERTNEKLKRNNNGDGTHIQCIAKKTEDVRVSTKGWDEPSTKVVGIEAGRSLVPRKSGGKNVDSVEDNIENNTAAKSPNSFMSLPSALRARHITITSKNKSSSKNIKKTHKKRNNSKDHDSANSSSDNNISVKRDVRNNNVNNNNNSSNSRTNNNFSNGGNNILNRKNNINVSNNNNNTKSNNIKHDTNKHSYYYCKFNNNRIQTSENNGNDMNSCNNYKTEVINTNNSKNTFNNDSNGINNNVYTTSCKIKNDDNVGSENYTEDREYCNNICYNKNKSHESVGAIQNVNIGVDNNNNNTSNNSELKKNAKTMSNNELKEKTRTLIRQSGSLDGWIEKPEAKYLLKQSVNRGFIHIQQQTGVCLRRMKTCDIADLRNIKEMAALPSSFTNDNIYTRYQNNNSDAVYYFVNSNQHSAFSTYVDDSSMKNDYNNQPCASMGNQFGSMNTFVSFEPNNSGSDYNQFGRSICCPLSNKNICQMRYLQQQPPSVHTPVLAVQYSQNMSNNQDLIVNNNQNLCCGDVLKFSGPLSSIPYCQLQPPYPHSINHQDNIIQKIEPVTANTNTTTINFNSCPAAYMQVTAQPQMQQKHMKNIPSTNVAYIPLVASNSSGVSISANSNFCMTPSPNNGFSKMSMLNRSNIYDTGDKTNPVFQLISNVPASGVVNQTLLLPPASQPLDQGANIIGNRIMGENGGNIRSNIEDNNTKSTVYEPENFSYSHSECVNNNEARNNLFGNSTYNNNNNFWKGKSKDNFFIDSTMANNVLSFGTQFHEKGTCNPCKYEWTRGCYMGEYCRFCHHESHTPAGARRVVPDVATTAATKVRSENLSHIRKQKTQARRLPTLSNNNGAGGGGRDTHVSGGGENMEIGRGNILKTGLGGNVKNEFWRNEKK